MADIKSLAGTAVRLVVSDPWDFVTKNGSGPFEGRIERLCPNSFLVHLNSSVMNGNRSFQYFIASPRYEKDVVVDLLKAATLHCNLVAIPDDRAHSGNPCDLSWWRGGLSLIGTVSLASSSANQGVAGKV